MKTILIATDFSKSVRNASKYGVASANETGAKVISFNAYFPHKPVPVITNWESLEKAFYERFNQTLK